MNIRSNKMRNVDFDSIKSLFRFQGKTVKNNSETSLSLASKL